MDKKPVIINLSYQVDPVYTEYNARHADYSFLGDDKDNKRQGYIDKIVYRDRCIAWCYSDDYELLVSEYIVRDEGTFHHLVARRLPGDSDER